MSAGFDHDLSVYEPVVAFQVQHLVCRASHDLWLAVYVACDAREEDLHECVKYKGNTFAVEAITARHSSRFAQVKPAIDERCVEPRDIFWWHLPITVYDHYRLAGRRFQSRPHVPAHSVRRVEFLSYHSPHSWLCQVLSRILLGNSSDDIWRGVATTWSVVSDKYDLVVKLCPYQHLLHSAEENPGKVTRPVGEDDDRDSRGVHMKILAYKPTLATIDKKYDRVYNTGVTVLLYLAKRFILL